MNFEGVDMDMAEQVIEKLDETFILDKIFEKYQMAIARHERLEAKISGYYTKKVSETGKTLDKV
jgi:non-homologous end joining protein Ku